MKTIQDAILNYAQSNRYLSPLIPFAHILAVIGPIYLLVNNIKFLPIYAGFVVGILDIAYYIGTILCFANNKLLPLSIAFGCMTFYYILNLKYGDFLHCFIFICFYGLLTGVCIAAMRNTSQLSKVKETTFSNSVNAYDTVVDHIVSSHKDSETVCPKCGNKVNSKTNFCSKCGNRIKD